MTSWTDHYVRRIIEAMQGDPARAAVHWRGQAVTAGELTDSVFQATAALRAHGVTAADTIAVLTEPNDPSMLVARYASHLLGAAVTYIRSMNPRSDADTFPHAIQAEILRRAGSRFLVVDQAHRDLGRSLAADVTGLAVVDDVSKVDDVGQCAGNRQELLRQARYEPGALAVIDFTSGSTGTPKMVRQTFAARDAIVRRLSDGLDRGAPARLLSVTPVSHTTAPLADAVLAGRGTVVLHQGFDAGDAIRAIETHRITDVYLAMPHLYRLLDHPGLGDADLSSLRRVTYSGTPAAPSRVRQAAARFGEALFQVYGSTEAGGITSLSPLDHCEPELLGTVGRPFPWVTVSIRDRRSGAEVRRGAPGEVWVRSATVMAGYLGDPALTARVMPDGWLRTGDLGCWDKHGYLRLTGRVGNVVKSGGLKLDPAAIEQALLAHPRVRNAAVYGVRDADYVERVHAAVELRARCSAADLSAHVAGALSAAHVPAAISVWDEIPTTSSGKPDQVALTAQSSRSML